MMPCFNRVQGFVGFHLLPFIVIDFDGVIGLLFRRDGLLGCFRHDVFRSRKIAQNDIVQVRVPHYIGSASEGVSFDWHCFS